MNIVGTNFAFMWTETLAEGFRHLRKIGLNRIELTVSLPHIDLDESVASNARAINYAAEQEGMTFSSVNPVEMNLISPNPGLAKASVQEMKKCIDLASEVGAPTVVVVPGRFNSLCPMLPHVALSVFRQRLAELLEHAEKRQVSLALENTPFGFLQTPLELLAQIEWFQHDRLGIVVDAANLHFVGTELSEVIAVADHLLLTHLSDTNRTKFAHDHLGAGDVDFKKFADCLNQIGYSGETVFELVTSGVDWPRWDKDFETLRQLGWA